MAKGTKYNYFTALEEMSSYSVQAVNYLDEVIRDYDPNKINMCIQKMHEIENKEDEKKHEIMKNLIREFLPPIDREDIIQLASELDDVTDLIDELLHLFYMLNIQTLIPEFTNLVELLKECCVAMDLAVKELKQFRKSTTIHDNVVRVNNAENKGDALYTDIMHKLYTSDKDAIDIMRWAEVMNVTENCYDACEHVSETIETIVMKNM